MTMDNENPDDLVLMTFWIQRGDRQIVRDKKIIAAEVSRRALAVECECDDPEEFNNHVDKKGMGWTSEARRRKEQEKAE